jgi:hypothetical protein
MASMGGLADCLHPVLPSSERAWNNCFSASAGERLLPVGKVEGESTSKTLCTQWICCCLSPQPSEDLCIATEQSTLSTPSNP